MKWFFDFFAGVPTSLIAFLSLIVAFIAYLFQRNALRKQKACELAKYYAEQIIPRIRFISLVLENIKQTPPDNQDEFVHIATDKFKGKMKRFDRGEYNELWGYAPNIKKTYLDNITYEHLKIASEKSLFDIESLCNEESTVDKIYPHVFGRIVRDLLNALEAFSMLFRYNIADEKMVYQSLHQVLLLRMPLLYYFIAEENLKTEERWYESIIWLYCKWEKRRNKQKKWLDSHPHGAIQGEKLR